MPNVPTLVKTWQIIPNIEAPNLGSGGTGIGDQAKDLFILLMQILTGTAYGGYSIATNPWVCKGSNNGTLAAMDGVNRITTRANMPCSASGARFWIVLKNNITGVELLFFGHSTSAGRQDGRDFGSLFSASAGFTGGTTATAPTATDEVATGASQQSNWPWLYGGSTAYAARVNVMQSTDGKETRMIVYINSVATSRWIITSPVGNVPTITEWATPHLVGFSTLGPTSGTSNLISNWTNSNYVDQGRLWGKRGATTIQLIMTAGAGNGGVIISQAISAKSPVRNGFICQPINTYCTTASNGDDFGTIPDMWLVPPVFVAGDTAPAALDPSPRQFLISGIFLDPWGTALPAPLVI